MSNHLIILNINSCFLDFVQISHQNLLCFSITEKGPIIKFTNR